MKHIETQKDLLDLIENKIEENLHLEFKSAGSFGKNGDKTKEISKDVSSFANSDGGIIVYGLYESKNQATQIDPIDAKEYSKEWLEQIIMSNISPRLPKYFIQSIPIDNDPMKVVYAISIEKSNTAHQAKDLRYYKRYNFMSVAMEDYEIRDIMNRRSFPEVSVDFELESNRYPRYTPALPMEPPQPTGEYGTRTYLHVRVRNDGNIYVKYINCFIEVPITLLEEKDYDGRRVVSREDGIQYARLTCSNDRLVLLPQTHLVIYKLFLKKELYEHYQNSTVYYQIHADNAEIKKGKAKILASEKFSTKSEF